MFGDMALTATEYEVVYQFFSLTLAIMAGAAVYFLASRKHVAPAYRTAVTTSAIITAIAAYHYLRLFQSWEAAVVMSEAGGYFFQAELFSSEYRYADWLITVPLLMVETVAVLNLKESVSRKLYAKLCISAALMIILGYPGQAAATEGARILWGTLSTIPFVYLLYVLWRELNQEMQDEPERVKVLFRNLRYLLLFTWGVYPIVYMFPLFGWNGSTALVVSQIAYATADLAAKAGYGLMIHAIAVNKTRYDLAEQPELLRNEYGLSSPVPAGAE